MARSPAVSYYDAFILMKNGVVFFSKLDALEHDDYSHSRVFDWHNGRWGHRDIPFMVNSGIAVIPASKNPPYLVFSLGLMSGAVEVYWPKGAKIEYEFLPGASKERGLLHLQQIREIGDSLYVVGPDNQIFRRLNGKWEVYNQGVETPSLDEFRVRNPDDAMGAFLRYCSLNSIDGSGGQDLYAVGDDGVIVHRGTGAWTFLPKATNAELRRVRQIDAKTVYAVGQRGTLLKGNAADGFQVIPTNISDDFWGLEWFNGKLYIGGATRGVFVYDGQSVNPAPGLPAFDCHTLHAKDGQLLAVGAKAVYLTDDAKTWTFLQNPDNV